MFCFAKTCWLSQKTRNVELESVLHGPALCPVSYRFYFKLAFCRLFVLLESRLLHTTMRNVELESVLTRRPRSHWIRRKRLVIDKSQLQVFLLLTQLATAIQGA